MNHKCALQRADGRWDYTCNRRATGYCCEYQPLKENDLVLPAQIAREENEKMEPLKHKFHTTGHATEEEARECYKQYLLDTRLRLMTEEPENANQQNRCQVCKKFTACYAQVGPYSLFVLCPEHNTRECVESLLKVGESWIS